jgi:error-prone DNA polymerase
MGWRNPPVPWSELERRLSDRPAPRTRSGDAVFPGDGGDSPAWSRARSAYEPLPIVPATPTFPYAELHCHSNFSFLDGASDPEELVEEAVHLGLSALALTDHNGFYGVVRFAEAARAHGLPTIFGVELTLGAAGPRSGTARNGQAPPPDPHGEHLVVLARDPVGYARLARAVSEAQLAGEKSAPRLAFERLVELGGTGTGDHWLVLTGCRKGTVPRVLEAEGPAAARRRLAELTDGFGRSNVVVELWDHGHPLDSVRNDGLAALAVDLGVDLVATNNVHYHRPARRRLATAVAAVRARRSLDELDGWLPAASSAHLRSGEEQARRFARWPGVVERAAELGLACAFDLALVAPELPPFPCPPGHDELSWLRELVARGAAERYGQPQAERVPGAYAQLEHELALIGQLGFPGYFLVVWDIVAFCRRSDIYCQGRGSAANSAVCYALGITNADAVALGLLFERFLSPERDGPPDIDIDIESGRREEVIQYVYERYGREHTAQVANVITYRSRSAVRDVAKALGYATGQQDAFAKSMDRWSSLGPSAAVAAGEGVPADVLELAAELEHAPRHLGIHSGGMVICDRPVVEVCPVEWARMENRSVLQWDKDDCAAVGLVKFDLLGLGMLSALHGAVDLIAAHHGVTVDIATIPQDDAVYDMLCRADSVGVFQVESRAQMATLPRLRPRTFYDLVVEVALIRPGPIQGGSVHPYIRRRNGREPVTYLHPLLEHALAKTLGIPLFQEQLMQMAIDVAGFTPAEADQLRQAMGSKRSRERMERLRARFHAGAAERGVTPDVIDQIWEKLAAFANYGFPESHSVSFAYLVYASAWIKHHYPAAFCAALLNAQPMGFYSPHSLVQDARRHGVEVRTPDVNASAAKATLEPCPGSTGGVAVRLGIGSVRGVGDDLAEAIAVGRPYASMEALVRRVPAVNLPVLEAMATAGAFDSVLPGGAGGDPRAARRAALWAAGAVSQSRPDRLPGIVTGADAPRLPGMSDRELALADLWSTGVSPDGHPTRFVRAELERMGAVPAAGLAALPDRSKVVVAGVVTHRQRPATAAGVTFLNLEDETGLINIVCSKGCWERHRQVARSAPALVVRGRVENAEGVVNVVAERLEPLTLGVGTVSRDFR